MTYAPTPVNSTDSALVTRVARYVMLAGNAEAEAAALDGIHDAENKINSHVWTWTRTVADLTLSTDAIDFITADAIKAPFLAGFLNTANQPVAPCSFADPRTFHLRFPDRSQVGTPRVYTAMNLRGNGLISLNCYPDQACVTNTPKLRIVFNRRIQRAEAGATTFDGPPEVESYMEWHAKSYIAAEYDPSGIAHAERKAAQLWEDLTTDDNEQDFRDWGEDSWLSGMASGGASSAAATVPSGATLPSAGNPGDVFRLTGPPDIFYQWMIAADSTYGWEEIYRGPDTHVAP